MSHVEASEREGPPRPTVPRARAGGRRRAQPKPGLVNNLGLWIGVLVVAQLFVLLDLEVPVVRPLIGLVTATPRPSAVTWAALAAAWARRASAAARAASAWACSKSTRGDTRCSNREVSRPASTIAAAVPPIIRRPAYASMQPRRPQLHSAPPGFTVIWPISPAAPRLPPNGRPSRMRPPPMPVPIHRPSTLR